jgi:hypothetical protein
MTPGDFIINLLPVDPHKVYAIGAGDRLTRCGVNMGGQLNAFWRLTGRRVFTRPSHVRLHHCDGSASVSAAAAGAFRIESTNNNQSRSGVTLT